MTSVLLSISATLGGVMSLNVNEVLQGINHISPIKYAIGNLAPYFMKHQHFVCTASQRLADGSCPIATRQQVLDLYNLDTDGPMNIMALGVCTVAYRFVAYALLKVFRPQEFLGQVMDLWARLRT